MVSATEIIEDIATKGEGEYKITWKAYKEVEDLLSNKRAKSAYFPPCQVISLMTHVYCRYSYNSVTGMLRFLMPTFIHASAAEWMKRWIDRMKTSGDIEMEGIDVINNATLEDFKLVYNRR
jgi:hypothetical protein